MKAGAHDFITKGNYVRLLPAIEREIEGYAKWKKANDEVKKTEAASLHHDHAKPPAADHLFNESGHLTGK